MKWLLYLFSFYILLLAATPCSADEGCTDEICNVSNSHDEDPGKSDHPPVCPCSPFFACASCHGVIVQENGFEFIVACPCQTTVCTNYIERLLPHYPQAIWQPPKSV